MVFNLGEYKSQVSITSKIPAINEIALSLGLESDNPSFKPLVIADENTTSIASKILGGSDLPLCVLKSGEEHKNWQSVQKILEAAKAAGLGRDGIFIAVGGGVIGDLAGFASSVYMRGCRFVLVSTTLLGMVDASVGGKTGFDLFEIKNLAGTFYPAEQIYMPVETLSSLAQREIKSGMAELIKTAVLAGNDFLDELGDSAANLKDFRFDAGGVGSCGLWSKMIERAVQFKGGIVSEDLRESENGKRRLLNLGHTFGHALESAAGLGTISHGEAVAWGIVRACCLGIELGITPPSRAQKIINLIKSFGYNCEGLSNFTSANIDTNTLLNAMQSDKKKKNGKLAFIVPDEKSAVPVYLENENNMQLIKKIINGGNKN